jgi:hypothetical protein
MGVLVEVWQMTDEQLGEEFKRAYDYIIEDHASITSVWMAQQAYKEACNRLHKYASVLGLKIEYISNRPLGS